MFAINFLRRQVPSAALRRAAAIGTLGVVAANLLVLIVFAGMAIRLQQHGGRRAPDASTTDELRATHARVASNLSALRGIVAVQQGRVPLAGKLAAVAATLPPRTWVANLSGTRADRTLSIDAVYVVDPAAPSDLPIKAWMNALKSDARFGQGLRTLALSSSSRASQGRAELMRFTLAARWEPSE